MSHLTDEQFEDLLQGTLPEPEHLRNCAVCQTQLEERRALKARLGAAFASVQAGSGLRERLLVATVSAPTSPPRTVRLHHHRRLWSMLAAAAVIILCVLPFGLFKSGSSQAYADQLALSEIHHLSLQNPEKLFRDDDPNRLANHMEQTSGQRPVMLKPCDKLLVCGGRSCSFKGRKVPTYMVESPEGRVSVVVIEETPEQLGLKHQPALGCWIATCKDCSIGALRLGDNTYYAVGGVSHEILAGVLNQLDR